MSENNHPIMQQDNAKGTTAVQAQVINVYNGITEERCREICMAVYRENIMSLVDEAKEIALSRAGHFTDTFIDKLTQLDEQIRQQIEKQLKEPAMQEAIFKSQKCYTMSNDEEHLKILTNMLIDRGCISKRTNKQMLIDEAIDVLPRLTQKHLDILAFYLATAFTHSFYNKKIVDEYIQHLIQYLQCILPIKKDDANLLYLAQKDCLTKYVGLEHLKGIEQILGDRILPLHSGFAKKDYDDLISVNIPEIIFTNSLIKPENVVINMPLDMLEKILKDKNVNKEDYDNIIQFWHRNNGEDDIPLIKEYIISNFENGYLLFENWQNIEKYNTSILGKTIAQAYFKTKYQEDINWDFE